MDIKTSKSIFAKLLAQENINVFHAKVPTASFDTKSRTLTLPIWADMDGDLYDLLCGHEVGHALYTPAKGWHDAICGEDGDMNNADMAMKGFLNVLEDARIEKKIKLKYPGLRANFYRAYQGLHEKDFFELAGKNIHEMLLIDRINLHFKLGSFLAVQFTEEEKQYVRRTEQLETWEEVEQLARDLMAYCKKEMEEKKGAIKKKLRVKIGPGEMGDGEKQLEDLDLDDYDEIEYEFENEFDDSDLTDQEREMLDQRQPVSDTDRAFREHEAQLLDPNSRSYEYITIPTLKAAPFIEGYKTVMQQMEFTPEQQERMSETLASFKKKNDKIINYLVKEFELRRNATQLARAKTSKSGEIDVKKIFSYRYNEDLFRRVTTVPMGKNHGLIMFYDMSGSMGQQMAAVIEQMLVLVEFCRKVNIPFEVYGFTNASHESDRDYGYAMLSRQDKVDGEAHIDDNWFRLRQYFSDTMRPQEYKRQVSNMCLLARIWRRRALRWSRGYSYSEAVDNIVPTLPEHEDLNGTPLNQCIMLSLDIYAKFIERTKAEVVNMAFLTDGDSDDALRYCRKSTGYDGVARYSVYSHNDPSRVNVVLTHKETRKSVKVDDLDQRTTCSLIRLAREVTGANIVCFDIVEHSGRRTLGHKIFKGSRVLTAEQLSVIDTAHRKFKKDRIYVVEDLGFNEYYLIPGGQELDIDDDDFAVEAGADKKKILKAFAQMQNNKTTSRILLNRFIQMIA